MKEKAVETQIIMWIRTIGGYVQKVQSGAMLKGYAKKTPYGPINRMYKINMADTGTPDLIGCIGGKFFAIEVKKDQKEIDKWRRTAETDKRSIAQHYQQDLIRNAGGITIIACSLEEVIQDFKALKLYYE